MVRVVERLGTLAAVMVLGCFATASSAADDGKLRDRALALNNITGNGPIEGEIKRLLADRAGTKKLLAEAVPMAKAKDQPFNFNAAYILGRAGIGTKDPDAAHLFFQICADDAVKIQSSRKAAQAYLGLLATIDLLYLDKQYERSVKLCQGFLETLDPKTLKKVGIRAEFKDQVLRRMIQALLRQGQTDQARRMVDNLLKARGDDYENLELKAWLQQETGESKEAGQTYERVLELVAKEKNLDDEERARLLRYYHYILSGVYAETNDMEKATAHLKSLLKEKPDDPTFNNDLGYIWADHDMNLDEAERMIRKAIEEERKQRKGKKGEEQAEDNKDNAAYLDSLGWVLFKQKKYAEAKTYLLQAVQEKEGQHVEIYDHLGAVYMALGDKAEAVAAWKKGVAAAGSTRREQEQKAKVEAKLKKSQETARRPS